MILDITIRADSDSPSDLNALAALIAALGGRAPTVTTTPVREVLAGPTIAEMQANGDIPNVPTTSTSTSGVASEPAGTAPTPDVGAPDRDSAGLPWDGRIHSESKATIGDGTWRKRRGVDEATYDAVMAELRGAPNPTLAPSTDDTPLPPAEPAVTETPVAAAASASEDVPPPPAADSNGPDLSSFPKFVSAVNSKDVPAELKTYDALNKICQETFGVNAFKDMKDRPNDWAMFYEMVG